MARLAHLERASIVIYFLYDNTQAFYPMRRSSITDQACPVGRAAGALVDAWSFLILRELFLGNRRFEGLRLHTGMSPRSLSLRLGRLVDEGLLVKQPCGEAPAFQEYRLSPKGLDLWPVMVMLRQWGERWGGPWGRGGVPVQLLHRSRGHALRAELHCTECGEPVGAHSAEVHTAPHGLRARAAFAAQVAQASPRRAR